MKILVVCQYYYPEPFRISDICEALVKIGHDVTVLTGLPNYPEGRVLSDYRNSKKRNEVINNVKVIRSFEVGRGNGSLKLFLNYVSFAVSASVKAFFLEKKFDVVMVNQLSPVMMAIPAIVYKKKHKKKFFLYCLDLWPASLEAGGIKGNSNIYKIFLKLSKWIYNSADSIAVTSGMFNDYFKDELKIKNKEIQYLPQYAEDLFSKTIETGQNGKYNFVFAGNIGDMQSVETIVKAANELQEYENIAFHIVGDGSKLEECKKLTQQLNLTNITYYGRRSVTDMPHFYSIASAMLLTLKDNKQISYTLPGKVQSYMAACKPIIAAINGEANRVIHEAECGLCCKAEDYMGLANLIIQFCESENKQQMANNSLAYYKQNFDKEKFFTALERILLELGD